MPAPAAAYPGGPQGSGTAPAKKKSKTPLIITLVSAAVVVALVIVGIVVVNVINKNQYGPDKVAEKYLDALSSGDFEKASSIVEPTVPEGTNDSLLDPKYAAKSTEKITDASVKDTQINGDKATITTSYTVGDQPYDMTLTATKDGKQGLFFDKWTLAGPTLQTIAMDLPAIDGVTVNGEAFTPASGRTVYAVLPGSYDVATPEATYYTSAKDQVSVGFSTEETPTAQEMNLAVEATDQYQTDVQKAVETKIDECAKSKDVMNEGCPFNADARDPVADKTVKEDAKKDSVKYTVDRQPKVDATLDTDLAAGSFLTDSAGKVSFEADSKTAGKGAWTGSQTIYPSGTVKIDGDKLSIEFYEN